MGSNVEAAKLTAVHEREVAAMPMLNYAFLIFIKIVSFKLAGYNLD